MRVNRNEFELKNQQVIHEEWKKENTLNDYEDFQRRMRIASTPKEESKKEGPKQKAKEAPKKSRPKDISAEEIFQLRPGESFTKKDLKKKYHDLLKQNHPDKVAAELKKSAELKTKEINIAYVKLKNRAA